MRKYKKQYEDGVFKMLKSLTLELSITTGFPPVRAYKRLHPVLAEPRGEHGLHISVFLHHQTCDISGFGKARIKLVCNGSLSDTKNAAWHGNQSAGAKGLAFFEVSKSKFQLFSDDSLYQNSRKFHVGRMFNNHCALFTV